MDKQRIFIGADVSKLTVDFSVLVEGVSTHEEVDNTEKAISKYFNNLKAKLGTEEAEVHVGIENTGRYCWPCLKAFAHAQVKLYLLSPLHLKKSLGMVRGKSDATDSERIVRFLSKNADELTLYNPPRQVIEELSLLLARRNKLLKQVSTEAHTEEELCCVASSAAKKFILQQSNNAIKQLKKQIERVELQIDKLIKSDEELNHKAKLMMSVPGVGKVLTWYLLVKTNEFKNINDPRKLACYAGVAPFEHSSGTSVRGKTRVSFFADKLLKKILHMAALRVIQLDGELRQFYLKKVAEGKNKMAIINALRNKIIHRIMAVIRDNRPYLKVYSSHLLLS